MRGSLRLRHQSGCPATGKGRNRDPRVCCCAPTVEVRFGGLGIERTVGYLGKGWRARDLDEFNGELQHMREQLLAGRAATQEGRHAQRLRRRLVRAAPRGRQAWPDLAAHLRETFDRVDVILDQAFGDALRARLGKPPSKRSPNPSPPDAGSLRPSRF